LQHFYADDSPLIRLQKPTDLPDSIHDNPLPVPGSVSTKDPLDTTPPKTPSSTLDDVDAGAVQPFHSFILAFTMIIFSEIGDKTFLVAALMAMRHPRLLVFSAAFSALVVMTVLSAVMGHAVPALLSERFTHFAAAALFLVFGVKLIREGLAMSPDDGVGEESLVLVHDAHDPTRDFLPPHVALLLPLIDRRRRAEALWAVLWALLTTSSLFFSALLGYRRL
jgi:putative Ca2+/H+ antiporter (TMEM165/GDT1 family)